MAWKYARVENRVTKVPISPWSGKPAATNRPETWSNERHARFAQRRYSCEGVGFVFTSQDPYCGIDLDHCRDSTGQLSQTAAAIVSDLSSYSEWSPSGNGVHILVRAEVPRSRRHRVPGIEIYGEGRYFTMTGDRLPGASLAIESRQPAINRIIASMSPKLDDSYQRPEHNRRCFKNDDELLLRARCARNGEKFTRLWIGDLSDYQGDHSRADAALCALLAFYTKGDSERMDRLFRASELCRAKWDRPTGGSTYGRLTIAAALAYAAGPDRVS